MPTAHGEFGDDGSIKSLPLIGIIDGRPPGPGRCSRARPGPICPDRMPGPKSGPTRYTNLET